MRLRCKFTTSNQQIIGLFAFVALYVTTPLGHAGSIYRCVDAHGQVTVGDLPCVVRPAAVTKKEQENKKEPEKQPVASIHAEKGQDALFRETVEQKILSKHSTQCRDLRLLLRKNGHFASDPLTPATTLSEADKHARDQYQLICMAQAKDVVVLAQIQSERISVERARKAACEIKTRDYESRKLSMNSASSDLERNAFGVLQAEVLRGCR
jgi:Domain of unknown function (DUF4124)